MTTQKNTSIKINPDLWALLKIDCIKKNKTISIKLEEMIKRELKLI